MPSTTLAPEPRTMDAPFGAEIPDLDLAEATAEDCVRIRHTLAEHAVLVFRNQDLDASRIAALGRKFGEPRPHVLLQYRVAGQPEVSMLTNVDSEGNVDPFGVSRAAVWHSDMTYRTQLPMLAMLHALEVPREKGGTLFADMRAAYDSLSEDLKRRLDGLTTLHGDATGPAGYRRNATEPDPAHDDGEADARHPAVRIHPVSGRRILFVNPMHTVGFEGVSESEGIALIEALAVHATQDKFLYYHDWQPGDLVIWDEASTMHRNAGDYDPVERRVFMRTIVF